jgi:stearoyl-CoA desaturase (Delta-9 desaturase)
MTQTKLRSKKRRQRAAAALSAPAPAPKLTEPAAPLENALPVQTQATPVEGLPQWMRNIPFLSMHVACIGVFFFSPTPLSLGLCAGLYFIRMFGITAGYHRYFSHRSYKTSRVMQFVLAWLGCSSMQKGPLWWAAHHRQHHRFSDTPKDPHSPLEKGFWWSHIGWILDGSSDDANLSTVNDLTKYPELRWLNNLQWVPGIVLAITCYLIDSWSGLFWGFFLSTALLFHGTFTVNSLCHLWGARRYKTTDESRNNFWVALITLGEGWHNNHHHYQSSANQGFFWWEIDISYYMIKAMGCIGLAWDIRKPAAHCLKATAQEPVADKQPDIKLVAEATHA